VRAALLGERSGAIIWHGRTFRGGGGPASLMQSPLTCPQCFKPVPVRAGVRFCPRCGLADVRTAAADTGPIDIPVGGQTFRVLGRLAVGSVSAVYRCLYFEGPHEVEAVLKVARVSGSNALILNEGRMLGRLHAADPGNRFTPFLPYVRATFGIGDDGRNPPRQANVVCVHPSIRSPADELYTLPEVRAAYPAGLDVRHVAWIWRRVLTALGFAHATGIVHGAVLPPHLLVEPREHKVVLIDWCCATDVGRVPPRPIAGGYLDWYRRESAGHDAAISAIDIALAARSMIWLAGGDPARAELPAAVDPALRRYFARCVGFTAAARPDAGRLLTDFDALIEAMWGPRRFAPLALPPKGFGK
jgi:hypothetical protein